MPTGEHLKKENRVNGKIQVAPDRKKLIAMAKKLGVKGIEKRSTERLAETVITQANLGPLRIPGQAHGGAMWNWAKVIPILTQRILENPLGGLRAAVKEPYVDEDGEEWPLPSEMYFYEGVRRGGDPDIEFMVSEMRRIQSEAMGDAVMEHVMGVEEWVMEERESKNGTVVQTARQNTAGISKAKLIADQAKYLSASWNERYVQKQRSEVEVRDPMLKDVIEQGMPSLEKFKE